ncbi:unnamed protein product [marine sediment metagenome]|uniref:Uncharacterized protein n=1 Tax=marine sediment metagenome TaxID=412755 RepID=X1LKS0_9ZZZZ
MKAYAIKTKRGYITGNGVSAYGNLIYAYLYRTKREAFIDACDADKIVPVEIKLLKRKKK